MNARRLIFGLAALVLTIASVEAQEIVVSGGPPKELRKNLDAFQKAFNTGDPAQYEAMAKSTFTEAYLKKQTPEERRKEYTKWRSGFGSIQFREVERRGPEAPLEITVKGSTASGLMWIVLDGFRIDGVKAEVEEKAKPKQDAHSRH